MMSLLRTKAKDVFTKLAGGQIRGVHDGVGILGIPFAKGQLKPGVALGPQALREANIVKAIEGQGFKVFDHGDMKFADVPNDQKYFNINNFEAVGNAMQQISEKVAGIRRQDQLCITLGGDHSIAIGSIHGDAQVTKDMTVIWVDAHADLNPPKLSLSGNSHGMVLSFLLQELAHTVPTQHPAYNWLGPVIKAKDVAYIALRDIDNAERSIIEKLEITCFTMQDVDRHGIDYVLEQALDAVNPGLKRPIHLSFDIDSLDPRYAASTGTPVAGGLTLREGMYIMEEIALTGQLKCLDLVEVNPTLEGEAEQKTTVNSAVSLLQACFGNRGMYVPPGYEAPTLDPIYDTEAKA